MSEDPERNGKPWIAWCSGIIVLLGLYVGAYAALAQAAIFEVDTGGAYLTVIEVRYGPENSRMDRIGQVVFAPVHAVDRRLYPSDWNTP